MKFVAIPIEARIDEAAHEHTYYCLEPLPFKIKVLGSAPTVREGFSDKTYPINLGTLSVRIAKSQFEKVRDHGDGVYSLLHVPLRGVHVETEGAIGVRKIGTPEADVVLLAKSDMASFADSLTAPLSVINAIIVAAGLQSEKQVQEHLKELENVWNRDQVYLTDGGAER